MNLAALILTAITAIAALWTVRLAYKAIALAKESAKSAAESSETSSRAAIAAEHTADAANKTVEEVRLGRVRDLLISERERFFTLIELVEELQVLQRTTRYAAEAAWSNKRNLLAAKLSYSVETFPITGEVLAAEPSQARLQDAREEIKRAIDTIEIRIYQHDHPESDSRV
jgi:hypothetical protein